MKLDRNQQTFFVLLRLGIGHTDITDGIDFPRLSAEEWLDLKILAEKQGLSAVVVDGIERLQKELMPPKLMLVQWIGEVSQIYEKRFAEYRKAISDLAGFYNSHGFKMMVLKGYACSLDWPKPEHRPCGDIDVWLFGQQKEADAALGSWFKAQGLQAAIDISHHHHTVFEWQGFTVENHYDFVNVHAHRSCAELEEVFKELGQDDSNHTEIWNDSNGTTTKVYIPPTNLHALFLIRHLANHFASIEITFRQILDWAFFVERHGCNIDWNWFKGQIERFHLTDFYNCINEICVSDLGFDVKIFPNVQFDPYLKNRVQKDILSPYFDRGIPKNVIKRIVWKYRRWKANEWKHKLCYKESMWSAFWSGVWSHLLKPSSI